MLDKTFWGLLESQTEALKNSNDKDSNTILLETAKLLLSYVDSSDEILSVCDKFEIRELFAEYADVAIFATDFFNSKKNILDPSALSGTIGRKLAAVATEIQSVKSALTAITLNESELIKRESELSDIKKEYQELADKVTELRAIRDTMTPEILAQMRIDIDTYETEITKSKIEFDRLRQELSRLSDEMSEINKALGNAAEEKDALGEEIIEIISNHYETLKLLFEAHNMDADKIAQCIREYQATYSRLEVETAQNAETLSAYEAYLGENSKIVESMKKYGVKSLNAVLDDISRIKKTIDDDLAAYDLILQKVIIHEEEIRKGIERRQGRAF